MFPSASAMSRSERLFCQLTKYRFHLSFLCNSKNLKSSTQACTKEHQYDVHNYQVPLTEAQKLEVLNTLNTVTEEGLHSYKLPKNVVQKLMTTRKKKKQFNDLKELIFIDGIGLKKIELICNHILYGDEPTKVKPKTVKKNSLGVIQPKITDYQNVTNIVGIAVKNCRVSWCQLQKLEVTQSSADCNESQIRDPSRRPSPESSLSIEDAITSNISSESDPAWCIRQLESMKILDFKADSLDIFTAVQAAVDAMPLSDVYIVPERHSAQSSSQSPLAFYVAHAYGLLAVLLNQKALRATEALHGNSEENSQSTSLSICREDDLLNTSKSSGKAVYFAKEPKILRSLEIQQSGKRLFGARVLYATLESGGTAPVLSGGLDVPEPITQKFRVLQDLDKHSQAAALGMALAFPAAYGV